MLRENTTKNTHNVVMDLVQSVTPKDSLVMDLPCGEGAFTDRLVRAGYTDVYAGDIVNILKANSEKFRQVDLDKDIASPDRPVKTIASIDGIEHFENPFHFVRQCNRLLGTGGHLVISTPNISALRSRWRYFLTGFHNKCKAPLDENNRNPLHHINMMSFPELRYVLHSSGFEILDVKANRAKGMGWLYLWILPFSYLFSLWAFKKEARTESEKAVHKNVLKQMFSLPVLLGETIIIRAKKVRECR